MDRFDCSKPNVTFGIAFKTYKNNRGVTTADLLDFKQELKMYKTLDEKLKKDTFIKKGNGIQSGDLYLEKDDTKVWKSIRYTDNTGNYFMLDNGTALNGLSSAFKKVKKSIDNVFENNSK